MAFTMRVAELIAADRSGLLSQHESWERVALSEIAVITNGAPFDSSLFTTSSGMPLARIRDVLTGETSTFYTGPYQDEHVIRHGDLLVGMDGDFNSAFWGNQIALLNQRVCKLSPEPRYYDKRLLAYVLPGYLAAINANTPSVTVKHLSSRTIGEIDLPLPPRNEQTRIVEKLEELLGDLDAGVTELKAAQKKLTQYRQSLLKAAVEGALTADWRARNPPRETGADLLARILQERRARWEAQQLARFEAQGKNPPKNWQARYPEPIAPDTTELPALPLGWVWASVDQLSPNDLANGKSVPTGDEAGGKVLRLTAVRERLVDLNEWKYGAWTREEALTYRVAKGDLLIVRGNGSLRLVGRMGLVGETADPVAFPDTLIRLRVLDRYVRPEWVSWVWDSAQSRAHIEQRARTSAGIYKISQPDISSVVLPIPPVHEQDQLLSIYPAYQQFVDRLETSIALGLQRSTAQRQNLLKAAFSGQLVPQEPSDEPASALLARIRAERAAQGTPQALQTHKRRKATS